jgi:pimeloyl-ACP methyl ester carboxylesterase
MFELLTGSIPEPGLSPRWAGVPAADRERVQTALDRGLRIKPEDRPATAGELIGAMLPSVEQRFVQVEGFNVAYQILGRGPVDLVVTATPQRPWDEIHAHAFRRMSTFARCVCVENPPLVDVVMNLGMMQPDEAGVARASDPHAMVRSLIDLNVKPAAKILEDIGSERAILFGNNNVCPHIVAIAADPPNHVAGIVLVDGFARWTCAPDYPSGIPVERWESLREPMSRGWGTGSTVRGLGEILGIDVPPEAIEEGAAFERANGGPVLAGFMIDLYLGSDVRHLLHAISVPALVIQHEHPFPMEWGRYLAEHIPDATLITIPGMSAGPHSDAVTDEVERFISERFTN